MCSDLVTQLLYQGKMGIACIPVYTIRIVVCFSLIVYRTNNVNLALKQQTSQLSQSDQEKNGNLHFIISNTMI